MATIRLYDHGKCHCGTDDIQVGCRVDVYDAEIEEEGYRHLAEALGQEVKKDGRTYGA